MVIVCMKHENISRQVNKITGEVRKMSGEMIQKSVMFYILAIIKMCIYV